MGKPEPKNVQGLGELSSLPMAKQELGRTWKLKRLKTKKITCHNGLLHITIEIFGSLYGNQLDYITY